MFALNGYITMSCFLIMLGVILDIFDGAIARLDSEQSPYGIDLDSFADLITFGVATGVLIFVNYKSLPIQVLIIVFILCGTLRLARHNSLAHQSSWSKNVIVGLPITTAGILIPILILLNVQSGIMLCTLIITSLLLISNKVTPKYMFSISRSKELNS